MSEFDGYNWEPPKPGEVEIRYSKISEKHKEYLRKKKRGGRVGKEEKEQRPKAYARPVSKKEDERQQRLGAKNDGKPKKRTSGRQSGNKQAQRKPRTG